jgi:uncharacterized C2H2 Zn-finger protein
LYSKHFEQSSSWITIAGKTPLQAKKKNYRTLIQDLTPVQ